jgi:hypothetical protein
MTFGNIRANGVRSHGRKRDRSTMVARGIGGANLTVGVNNGRRNA